MVVSDSLTHGDVFGALEGVSRPLWSTHQPDGIQRCRILETREGRERIRHARARRTEGLGDRIGEAISPSRLEQIEIGVGQMAKRKAGTKKTTKQAANGKNGGIVSLTKELFQAAIPLRGSMEPADYKR